jgi:hypothetical protein
VKDSGLFNCSWKYVSGAAWVCFMTIIVLALKRRLRPTLRVFFGYVYLKKKPVGYPFVMSFEDQSGSVSQEICDLFVGLM